MLDASARTERSPDAVYRISGNVLLLAWLGFLFCGKISWVTQIPSLDEVVAVVLLTAVYVTASHRLVRASLHSRQRRTSIPLRILPVFLSTLLLILLLDLHASGLAVSFVGVVTMVLRLALASLLCLPVLGVVGVVQITSGASPLQLLVLVSGATGLGAVCFLVSWLTTRHRETVYLASQQTRDALTEQRLRFSRELHDILGHSLSVIAVQSELATQLATTRPEDARRVLRSIAELSQSSIVDTRQIVDGYRMPPLATQLAEVTSVLRTAGVPTEVNAVPERLPRPVEEALGWVVREATTNILRHSNATRCSIRSRRTPGHVVLEVHNDGVEHCRRRDGSGLPGLRDRINAVGGNLTWGYRKEAGYSVRAEIPC